MKESKRQRNRKNRLRRKGGDDRCNEGYGD
jgi:hypothetical protein